MQKPFKRQPEFDEMMAQVLKKDPRGRLLLHGVAAAKNQATMAERLRGYGADMSRTHFLPVQPHHRLLALYQLSDVSLDSYPAGGCTTTREALALGSPVVTLPHKYLGSRWSKAYYDIMGMKELVAADIDDYVNIAVRLGTDDVWRKQVIAKVRERVHLLYHRTESIDAWATLLSFLAEEGPPKSTPGEEEDEAGAVVAMDGTRVVFGLA